ncbi:two component transcriptional regulator, AraC family [Mesobacillus persicus]|uniref:Two component transcriptional regulator, AraC family n=1 Tax=Mesobacillus persicus TaxID=930146 RepID=A0A1H8FXS8_9BACI|nr:response regulator [Mesobacillus persicus]SEN36502.1 two component transcriptional regulator, AraC family [Mesobacillus persicus]
MYRILIVDDEAIERKGLEMIITENFPSVLIDEADSGRTAILKAEEFRPDIIFLDIKMPGIDGVEAAKEIKKTNGSINIFMLTAFDKFEYARQLMKIGVRDYILKPYNREEIIEPLRNTIQEIEQEKAKRTEELTLRDNYRRALSIVQSRVITSMIMQASTKQNLIESDLEGTFQKESFVMVFEWMKLNENPIQQEPGEVISFVQKGLSAYFPNHFVGEETMDRIPILIQVDEKNTDNKTKVKELAMTCGRDMISKLRQAFPDFQFSIGIGRLYDEVEKFVQSYHEALYALSSIQRPYQVHYYNQQITEKADHQGRTYSYELEKKLLEAVTSGLVDDVPMHYKKYMDSLVAYCKNTKEMEEKASEFLVLLSRQIMDSGILISVNRNLVESNGVFKLQDELMNIANHIHSMYYSQSKDIMAIAKEYIAEHFDKALTLEDVAEVVNLSPQYFSKIFKERAGSSFIDYLTEMRVERAKELIRSKQKSVKEVCYHVGYKDPNYFSRVFKKYTGISPSDYRQSIH